MIFLIRYSSECRDFQLLADMLDKELEDRYGEIQEEYNEFNTLELIRNFVIAYEDEEAVGCGAFKFYREDTAEIKRMFVKKEHRGKGISRKVLTELEQWAYESGYNRVILETGIKQHEAIGLYKKSGYVQIENYGQYAGKIYSYCMSKELIER